MIGTTDCITSGPLGSYTYGDSAHLHAATSVGSGYTASYDAAGNMLCRAPTASTTCSGTPTGAQSSYDNEGRLAAWQNAPSSPTSTANYLYDGEGNRVFQQTTTNGSTTSTTYVGNLEDITTSGSTTTTTAYYYLGGERVAESVNSTISYLLSDRLGSAEVALNSSGSATASTLFGPYGQARYTNGSMPGSCGYTGQRDDTAVTGLDYYNARYYDPTLGQFASADTMLDGLNRYAYVGGNPESGTDPSGHLCDVVPGCVDQGWPAPAGGATGGGDTGGGSNSLPPGIQNSLQDVDFNLNVLYGPDPGYEDVTYVDAEGFEVGTRTGLPRPRQPVPGRRDGAPDHGRDRRVG